MNEDRRHQGNRRHSREGGRRATDEFLTPGDLCDRWKIDPRTLDKLELPWIWITPKVRRVSAHFVYSFESDQNLRITT